MTLSVVGLEPFDGGSHRAVRESLSRHSRHRIRWLCRPARAWKWRMRTGALELLALGDETDAWSEPIDVVLATSLLDLAVVRAGLTQRGVNVPHVLYVHENQCVYPAGPSLDASSERDVHFALTNLTSMLSADLVAWNSDWNRRSFLEGIDTVLEHAPNGPLGDVGARIGERSRIAWPPVEPVDVTPRRGAVPERGAVIVWPHRWEHDKGPDELLDLARRHRDRELRWILLGEQFRSTPTALRQFLTEFDDSILHAGFVPDRRAYLAQLARADWVLSTARHEFFGIAVVEALLCGCLPWLPERLSYPELLPPGAIGLSPACPPPEADAMRHAIADHLAPANAAAAVRWIDDLLDEGVSR